MKLLLLVGILGLAVSALAAGNGKKGAHGTMEDRQRLRNALFDNYDRLNIPDNVTTELGFNLISFDVDESTNSIKVYGWMRQTWTDERLKWDAHDLPVDSLRVGNEEVWRPDMVLYNSIDLRDVTPCGQTNVLLYPTGKVLWVPPCTFEAYCEDLTQKDAPTLNAEHTCELKFGSWTLDGYSMDLQSYGNETKVDLTDFRDSSNWKVLGTEVTRTDKYYPCCTEPYVSISFKIKFQKKSG